MCFLDVVQIVPIIMKKKKRNKYKVSLYHPHVSFLNEVRSSGFFSHDVLLNYNLYSKSPIITTKCRHTKGKNHESEEDSTYVTLSQLCCSCKDF